MKRLLLILILTFSFQSLTKADDISDFEIEGMSIGDSVLDHFNQKEIIEALKNPTYYKNKKFVEVFLNYKGSEFDLLQVAFEPNDKKFIIDKIMLIKNFNDGIEKCNKYKKKLISESLDFVNDSERVDQNKRASIDSTGNSFRYMSTFFHSKGGFFNFVCTDYGQEVMDKHGWFDNFTVSVGSDNIKKFLQSD